MRKSAKKTAFVKSKVTALPQWLDESMCQPVCAPENFAMRRQYLLNMSVEQCAAWLRVHRTTVQRWESGKDRIPFAAFEAMRLLYDHIIYQRQNDQWLGWKFTKAGELVNPNGTLIFTPARLLAVDSAFRLSAIHALDNAQLKTDLAAANEEIERLRVENIKLREMAAADVMVDELHAIRSHVDSLLALVDRAKVYQFPAGRAA